MNLPTVLTQASRQGRLLVLWGGLPFPLAERPPANRAQALNRWAAQAERLSLPQLPLPQLPPLPTLSLDPTDRLERAFAAAGVPLHPPVRSSRDVPARGQHSLLKLAGDLATRRGVVLSRAELRELRSAPDKRHLLAEARRLCKGGALLLLGCDPESGDFRAWWSVLAPAFRGAVLYVVGDPSSPWPEGVLCLGADWDALNESLWAAQPEPELEPEAEATPPRSEAKYIINVEHFHGAVGDEARGEQRFAAPSQVVRGDWETLIAQVLSRLDALSAQVGRGVDDLKRGQTALYHQVDAAHRDDLARVLAAVQQGRMAQSKMAATLDALRRAMRAVMREGLPMDDELRTAVADLTEAVESSLGLDRKLELALPLLPLLTYKIELGVGSELDLHALWDDLRARFG